MMDVFPAIYSTLSPKALVDGVVTQYPLEAIERCVFWHRGLSDIYLVKARTSSYILKISHHHWRSRSDIEFELELLDFLYQQGVPVAHPLKTKDGKLSVTIHALEGDRYAALFPYAPGKVPLGDLNLVQSKVLGKTLAKLHQTSANFQSSNIKQPLNLKYLLNDSLAVILPYLTKRNGDLEYLQEEIDKIERQITKIPQQEPFWSVCWGDPHSGNVHFTAENFVTLFDFDQCGYGWRAFDLAKFLQVSLRAGMSRKIRDAFFTGYQTIEKLQPIELDSLQSLTKMAHIWAWAIDINAQAVHNWSRLDSWYCTQRLQQLKRLGTPDWQLF